MSSASTSKVSFKLFLSLFRKHEATPRLTCFPANLAFQKALREIGAIVTAVAMGDLSKKVLIHAKEMDPEITLFKRTINTMVDQLQEFASQVTFLAREVGTEGRLGGQANLPGVAGIWAELTDSGTL